MDPVAWLFVEDSDFHPTLTPEFITLPPKPSKPARIQPPYPSKNKKKNTIDEVTERKNTAEDDRKLRSWLIAEGLKASHDNLARRHMEIKSAAELSQYTFNAELRIAEVKANIPHFKLINAEVPENVYRHIRCYGCSTNTDVTHRSYLFSCATCGNLFEKYRYLSRSLADNWALVTGGRTKLGYQIVLKLLRAGAHVIPTTRQPDRALEQYRAEPDSREWWDRLHMYTEGLDLLAPNLPLEIAKLYKFVRNLTGHLDILVNSAAQTIRAFNQPREIVSGQTNKYGDPAKLLSTESSWNLRLDEVSYSEWQEVFLVNAIAPALLIAQFTPLLKGEDVLRTSIPPFAYIINVHAREGLFDVRRKGNRHVHTNMAKAALAQLTRCCADRHALVLPGSAKRGIRVHGVDPGWISTDEYSELACPWIIPPLDDVDGAARVLQPLWEELPSEPKTRRHFTILKY